MRVIRKNILKTIGIIGTFLSLLVFIQEPSFPTPDKLLIFATFVAMCFGQAKELLRRFVPFVLLLLVYESFRGIADHLNSNVNFQFMVEADKLLFFGQLPTEVLQNLLWYGHVRWYDFVFYLAYMLHFVLPFVLAIFVWKLKDSYYWRYISAFVVVSFMGFLTYLVFPAAPPWMASDRNIIEPIARISSHVWFSLGVQDFPSLYNEISPNPVAAVPSLHAAYAFLFAWFVNKLFTWKYKWLAWIYPLLIWVGTIYQGEHYLIDVILGIIYAYAAYWLVEKYFKQHALKADKIKNKQKQFKK